MEHGRIIRIDHIGSSHTEAELDTLLAVAKQRLHGSQLSLFKDKNAPLKISLKESVSYLLLQTLTEEYNLLGFDQLKDDIFTDLCVARIVEPTSKLDSLRVLAELGVRGLSKNQLYRCLGQVIASDYRTTIAKQCFAQTNAKGISFLLYDVTTLYFEMQGEDDFRKPGMSKERRLEPQIMIGLLVDQFGFPLGLHSFKGNTAETTTILPVIDTFKKLHGLKDITVVADAAMLSSKNLAELDKSGYTYIVGSRMHKIPYDIAEYQKTQELIDNQIITTPLEGKQRIIYQFREKRAALDRHNIEKQIDKAEKIIDKARALAGIKGYITNLDAPDMQVISAYHQLWHVEKSFRMSKSDLKARPVFLHKRDSIEAHLTIVLAALAVAKMVEYKTGVSIKRFVKTMRPIRSGIVNINGQEYPAEAEIPNDVIPLLQNLKTTH
jgi:transposase